MNYIKALLDQLVEEGWMECIQNTETGYLFYVAADGTMNTEQIDRTED